MGTWNKIESIRARYYNRYAKKLYLAFLRQLQPVLSYPIYDVGNFILLIPILMDNDKLTMVMNDLYTDVGVDVHKNSDILIKNLEEDLFIENMRSFTETMIADKVVDMGRYSNEYLKRVVRKAYSEGLEEGLSIGDLEKKIKKQMRAVYGEFSKARAVRIAQTEIMTAANLSGYVTAQSTGLTMKKRWIPSPIGVARVQERHAILPDLPVQRPLMDHPFFVNGARMMYPGDPAGGAENVINCHCVLSYEVL